MTKACKSIQKAILKQGFAPGDLSEELLAHADHCEACAEIVEDARRFTTATKLAGTTSEPTDCRAAVMKRTEARPVARRYGPVYTFAGLSLLILIIIAGLHIGDKQHTSSKGVRSAAHPVKPKTPVNVEQQDEKTVAQQEKIIISYRTDRHTERKLAYSKHHITRHNKEKDRALPASPKPVADTVKIAEQPSERVANQPSEVTENASETEKIVSADNMQPNDPKYMRKYVSCSNGRGDSVIWMIFLPTGGQGGQLPALPETMAQRLKIKRALACKSTPEIMIYGGEEYLR